MEPVQAATDALAGVATLPASTVARMCEWDGCLPLTGRQKRFATDACRSAWHDAQHPRVAPAVPGAFRDCGSIKQRYLGLMADGAWRTNAQAAFALRENESVVGRKRRELAERHRFEVKRTGGPQTPWMFRLVVA